MTELVANGLLGVIDDVNYVYAFRNAMFIATVFTLFCENKDAGILSYFTISGTNNILRV